MKLSIGWAFRTALFARSKAQIRGPESNWPQHAGNRSRVFRSLGRRATEVGGLRPADGCVRELGLAEELGALALAEHGDAHRGEAYGCGHEVVEGCAVCCQFGVLCCPGRA